MKKRPSSLLPFALAVVALFTPEAQGRPCRDFFAGGQPPVLANPKLAPRTTLLCNGGYAVLASGLTRGALWSAEYLTVRAIEVARYTPRAGQFHPDNRLSPEDRAELRDYVRSGYDRGHMTPSGDMPDAEIQQETFSLANIVPQTPELNRGVWEGVESAVRYLTEREGSLYDRPGLSGEQPAGIARTRAGSECHVEGRL